ncbi:SMC-Scp complex subunit ScpB [Candidatus Wolfebacteria bacterium]|nr:SMC-Scp complex subunit ScpB [Candidatus Wolfebacteria bacterium]
MEQRYILESLLFISGHPLSYKKLAEVLAVSEVDVEKSLKELAEDYAKTNRGLRLVFLDGKAQLAAPPESKEMVEKLVKSDFNEELTPAALETLAIVAYKGPISRAAIENLRGVNCSFILQNLAIRGLVEKKNNPADGRSYIYSITFDFLKHLGVNELKNLPNYKEISNSFKPI